MEKMQHWIGRAAQTEVTSRPIILFPKLNGCQLQMQGAPVELNYYTGVTLKRTALSLGCSEPEVADELTHYSQVCFLLKNESELLLEAVLQDIPCQFDKFSRAYQLNLQEMQIYGRCRQSPPSSK